MYIGQKHPGVGGIVAQRQPRGRELYRKETPWGSQWIQMDPDGYIWIPNDPNGSKWILIDTYGSQLIPMDPDGCQ